MESKLCPLCSMPLVDGASINKHHLVPKLKGGKQCIVLHKVCHEKIHSIWSPNELRDRYNNLDSILEDSRIQKFIKFVRKKFEKDPEFIDTNRQIKNHKKKRR